MIALFSSIIQLVLKILGEYFAAQDRAREQKIKYEMNKQAFKDMTEKALAKMLDDAKKESEQAQSIEDDIDNELHK